MPAEAGDVTLQDFDAQCAAMLDAGPAVISSIMGVYPPEFVAGMKARGIRWMATVTTVGEAEAAVAAGADGLFFGGGDFFLKQVVAVLISSVYAFGFSSGGQMANRWGCEGREVDGVVGAALAWGAWLVAGRLIRRGDRKEDKPGSIEVQ